MGAKKVQSEAKQRTRSHFPRVEVTSHSQRSRKLLAKHLIIILAKFLIKSSQRPSYKSYQNVLLHYKSGF